MPNSAESSKACSPSSAAIALRGGAGIAGDGEVEIGDLAAERRVADGAADDPDVRPLAQRPPRSGNQRRGAEAIGEVALLPLIAE